MDKSIVYFLPRNQSIGKPIKSMGESLEKIDLLGELLQRLKILQSASLGS